MQHGSIEQILEELDFYVSQGLGTERPAKRIGEFVSDFSSIAAASAEYQTAIVDADNLDEPYGASDWNGGSNIGKDQIDVTGTPASGQSNNNAASSIEDEAAANIPHLLAEAPPLMINEAGADAVMQLLVYVVGQSAGADSRHLNCHLQDQDHWLAIANAYFSTPHSSATVADVTESSETESMSAYEASENASHESDISE